MAEPRAAALISVDDLTPAEIEFIERRVAGQSDFTITDWRAEIAYRHVFAAYRDGRLVGMCCWAGMPDQAQPYMWILPDERCKGNGSAVADALVETMKSLGVTGLAKMPIVATGDEYYTASRLAARLRARFRDP